MSLCYVKKFKLISIKFEFLQIFKDASQLGSCLWLNYAEIE